MSRKRLCLIVLFLHLATIASAELVGHWKLDEGSGTVANDSSGYENHGTLQNSPTWVPGQFSNALQFDGLEDFVEVPHADILTVDTEVTVMAWINAERHAGRSGNWQGIMGKSNNPRSYSFLTQISGSLHFSTTSGGAYVGSVSTGQIPLNEWTHVCAMVIEGGHRYYINGENAGDAQSGIVLSGAADTATVKIGWSNATNHFLGMIDDVRLYNHGLDAVEVQQAMQPASKGAVNPNPLNEAIDVPRDVTLSWTPEESAATRNVYLGTAFSDVNDADQADVTGILVGQNQMATTLVAGILEFGQTYYWRVDEVNAAPDNTVFRGEIWSLTVEPVAVPIEAIIATASGANPGMEASKTVDGSGLDALDQHSVLGSDMWLTLTSGSWIQYEFDKAYKLHEMLVWNSNQIVEPFIGFGIKDVVIETSVDGDVWTAVEGVPPFAQGSGQATYQSNTTVDLSRITARFVRITPQSVHGFTGQSGLSEVRFLVIPTDPRELIPADGSVTADVEVTLNWRAGREAATHEVYLGIDPTNLALVGTVSEDVFTTDNLDYDQTYYWQVVEVNEAETPARYASGIQTFTTPAYGIVDDFESYSGNEGEEVFLAWLDGFGGDASLGGSTTGHIDGPFVETSNTHPGTGSSKSMPIYIDNDGGFFDINGKTSSPTFSEVVREFDSAQDWTARGVKTLSIMFSGSTGLTGQLYCKIDGTKRLYDGGASALGAAAWQAWNIDLAAVGGNLKSVRELAIGVDGGSSGILYVDDIRLYTQMGEMITPVMPAESDPSLVAHYEFEGNASDTKGNYHGTAEGEPGYAAGKSGQAMTFDGIDDRVVHALAQEEVWPAYSVGLWVRTDAFYQAINNSPFNNNSSSSDFQFDVDGSDPGRYRYLGSATIVLGSVTDEWVHLAASCDGTSTGVYFDGLLIDTADIADNRFGQIAIGINRAGDKRFIGTIDDVRVYDRALSAAEIAGLAGRTADIHVPF